MIQTDIEYMQIAMEETKKAAALGEVPIGAVIVMDKNVIGLGHNKCEVLKDATAHAEILAIKEASKSLDNWRLNGATLYVTLEPCIMCVGAIIQSRISRIVYGATDPKAGACGSVYNLVAPHLLDHEVEVVGGILKEDCLDLIQAFFKKRRKIA
jgi:tRNA(adenine34) deaminase